ncbi:MAG: two-component regulator propeller domain-containing protein, partial [Chloroflexaceae bacterium]
VPAPTEAPTTSALLPTAPMTLTVEPVPTAVPTAPQATLDVPLGVAVIGRGALIAVGGGANTVSFLRDDTWVPIPDLQLRACLGTGVAFFDSEAIAWAGCHDLIRSMDGGDTWATAPGERSLPELSFVDVQDRIWWVERTRITVFDSKTGAPEASYVVVDATGEQSFPFEAAAIAANGVLWLGGLNVGGSDLVAFDGTSWQSYGEPAALGLQVFESPKALLAHSDGRVLLATSGNLYTIEGSALTPQIPDGLARDLPGTIKQLIELPDGAVAMASLEGIAIWDGQMLSRIRRADGLPSNKVHTLAVDGAGRLWAGTEYGLAVQDGQGGWQTAVPSNSELGDSRIVAIAVLGAPALPAPLQARTTTVSGRLLEGGAPVAGSAVQLCGETGQLFTGRRPCEGQSLELNATTDAEGRFRIENVPLATLSLAAQKGDGQWIIFLGGIPALSADQEVELGDIKLDD